MAKCKALTGMAVKWLNWS